MSTPRLRVDGDEPTATARLDRWLLAAVFAIYGGGLFAVLYQSLEVLPRTVRGLATYGCALAVVPLLALAGIAAIDRLTRRLPATVRDGIYPPLVTFGAALTAAATTAISTAPLPVSVLTWWYALAFPLCELGLLLWVMRSATRSEPGADAVGSAAMPLLLAGSWAAACGGLALWADGCTPVASPWLWSLLAAAGLLVIVPPVFFRHSHGVAAILAGVVATSLLELGGIVWPAVLAVVTPGVYLWRHAGHAAAPRPTARSTHLVDLLAIIWIAAVAIDLSFPQDRLHHNAYLGAVNDVLRGKTVLVDTFSQYGVGSIYALALVFGSRLLPFTYSGFSLLVSLLLLAQFAVLYGLLRTVLHSPRTALIVTTGAVMLHIFTDEFPPTLFPSVSPLRFGLLYLPLGLLALRHGHPRWTKGLLVAEHLAVGVAAMWSVEALLAVLATYGSLRCFEALVEHGRTRTAGRSSLLRLAAVGVTAACAILLVQLGTFVRSGAWPEWRIYSEILRHYSGSALYTFELSLWSPWVLYPCLYGLSAMVLLGKVLLPPAHDVSRSDIIAFGTTAIGAIQFAYWMANNTQLTAQVVPAVFLVTFWCSRLWRGALPSGFRLCALAVCGGATAVLLPLLLAGGSQVIRRTPLAWLMAQTSSVVGAESWTPDVRAQWNHPVGYYYSFAKYHTWRAGSHIDPAVRETLYLARKYAPGRSRLVLLVRSDSTIDALIRLRAANVFPVADALIESESPTASARALHFSHGLTPGDVVFVQLGFRKALFGVQKGILRRLCDEFAFERLQALPSGVAALRLGTQQERQSRPTADWTRPKLCEPRDPHDPPEPEGPDTDDE